MLILGTRINTDKALSVALQAIFGINLTCALRICACIGVKPSVKLKDLRSGRLNKLTKICREHVPTSLFRVKQDNIKALVQIKHYKGVRHMFGLPARGQRTRTNASTSKKLSTIKQQKQPPKSRRRA